MDREQAFKQLREALDFLEKSKETVHLPDNILEISEGEWSTNDNNIGQDIKESKLADLMRYLADMMG